MKIRRDYGEWPHDEPLMEPAEDVLAFLDELATMGRVEFEGEVVASVDAHGVVTATIPIGGRTELHLQVGDGWDRVLWTCPSGRTHEWIWKLAETPGDLIALIEGRGVERTYGFRRRTVGSDLRVGDDREHVVAGDLAPRVMKQLRLPFACVERPAR